MVQQMWADNLGIQGTINVLEANAFRAWVQQRKTEPYDIMIQGWWSDYADPANWYGDLIINDFRKSHFSNADFAALVDEGQCRAGSGETAGDLPGRQQDPGGRAADDGL